MSAGKKVVFMASRLLWKRKVTGWARTLHGLNHPFK
ncbi:hypothetical protein FHW73_002584 [Luteimonas sp. RC10]|nr:hypothetical protein [Luteimonas sp. RC10]